MKRTPIRRYAQRDPVSATLHDFVLHRDRGCVLRDQPGHVCKTIFGREHSPTDLKYLTLEHVKQELAMGQRAPSDKGHLVALCGWTNNKPPSAAEREVMRAHLATLYPETWAVTA